jgi:hypothetical protein
MRVLKIILTSGYPTDMWPEEECAGLNELPSNSVAILPKPFFPGTLLRSVREMIAPSVEAAVNATIERFGCIDILINNAGMYPRQRFVNMTEQQWD